MNCVVFAVGHSGTTIVTNMLIKLGWNAGYHDHHCENIEIRDINHQYLMINKFDYRNAKRILSTLPEPWVIKDPRFVLTQDKWNRVFKRLNITPFMIYLHRDINSVILSHEKRNEIISIEEVSRLQQLAKDAYDLYDGPKIAIEYENFVNTISLFDTNR